MWKEKLRPSPTCPLANSVDIFNSKLFALVCEDAGHGDGHAQKEYLWYHRERLTD